MSPSPDLIVGIDLGTTNSLVAYADASGPKLIGRPDQPGDVLVPSVVHVDPSSGRSTVGRSARLQAVEKSASTIHSIKRLMGRGFEELADECARLPYRVVRRSGERGDDRNRDIATVVVGDYRMTPPEISAVILRELKHRAEEHFGHPVNRAVVTVPAQFDDAQRQATRDAGLISGLDVVRVINEPTAAALAYGLDRREGSTVAVYDLGGGTFDLSILRISDGVFEVLSTNGDTHLGGDDFDRLLGDLIGGEMADQFSLDTAAPAFRQRMRIRAEELKIRLSQVDELDAEFDGGEGRVFRRRVTRSEFERLIDPLLDRTIDYCQRALLQAGLATGDIQQVVMVGGSTRIPRVRARVAELFGREPYVAINPEHVVALGAAIQGAILMGVQRDLTLLDVTPLSLGIETMGGGMGKLIPANVRTPCQATETFTTFQDGQTKIKINVLQGERELAADCRSLGIFELQGIPPMPAGIPKIEVTLLIDQNGILDVSARELRSGRRAGVQIVPAHGLTREEVKRMQTDALKWARQDMQAHHLIDVRTTIEFDLNKAAGMLRRHDRLFDEAELAKVAQAARELRDLSATSEDASLLNQRREEFNRALLPLAERAVARTLRDEETSNLDEGRTENPGVTQTAGKDRKGT